MIEADSLTLAAAPEPLPPLGPEQGWGKWLAEKWAALKDGGPGGPTTSYLADELIGEAA